VFGERAANMPVTALKSMIGHCLGAAGALEAAALALTVSRKAIPPTINHTETDPECGIDVVANTTREQPVRCGVSTSLGFGGNDAALVITAIG
jgi:3-oxoacyl-[acyl-carrier-protein] synthase II